MFERNQRVFFSMNEQTWAFDICHFCFIVESLAYKAGGDEPKIWLGYTFKGSEGRNQYKSPTFVSASQMSGWTWSDRPAHHKNIPWIKPHDLCNKVPHRLDIFDDRFFAHFSRVYWITWVFNDQKVTLIERNSPRVCRWCLYKRNGIVRYLRHLHGRKSLV